jgi:hypothetical protein
MIPAIIFVILLITYFYWERTRNPLNAINNIDPEITLLYQNEYLETLITEKRIYKEIRLLSEKTDTISALLSFPPGYKSQTLPLIHVLGGINIGRENLRLIENPGSNIIVIFLYNYDMAEWETGTPFFEIPKIRSKALKTPAQICELQSWLLKQSWTDTNRVSLLGYSFGALFLPAAKNLAQKYSIKTGPCILAYGGADFNLLVKENLRIKPNWLRTPFAGLLSTMIHTIDPINHAADIKGDFYLINGIRDRQIPKQSWQLLHDLIPENKTIDLLDEGHMHPDKPQLTRKLTDMSRIYLASKNVLNH